MSLKVLYVDDEDDIREVATLSLEMDPDIEVRAARSAAEALEMLAGDPWRPDLFLLDVMMPEMDGPGLLREIRSRQEFDATPAVFITARAQAHERERLMATGAVEVIPKPFDPLKLAADVRAIVARSSAA